MPQMKVRHNNEWVDATTVLPGSLTAQDISYGEDSNVGDELDDINTAISGLTSTTEGLSTTVNTLVPKGVVIASREHISTVGDFSDFGYGVDSKGPYLISELVAPTDTSPELPTISVQWQMPHGTVVLNGVTDSALDRAAITATAIYSIYGATWRELTVVSESYAWWTTMTPSPGVTTNVSVLSLCPASWSSSNYLRFAASDVRGPYDETTHTYLPSNLGKSNVVWCVYTLVFTYKGKIYEQSYPSSTLQISNYNDTSRAN